MNVLNNAIHGAIDFINSDSSSDSDLWSDSSDEELLLLLLDETVILFFY